jgi:pyruvate dehydrogenase (quinone)
LGSAPPQPPAIFRDDGTCPRREQIELGNPTFGCALAPIDFVAFARARGADGFRCERPEEIRPAIQAALRSPKAALVEAVVDADERPANPDELRV